MPLRSDLIVKRYTINRNTTVTVKSQLIKGSDVYRNKLIVEHETADTKPLSFPTINDLQANIKAMELEEDQTEMQFGNDDE